MKVSIIMPVYNKAKYLENMVNCILSQTYTNFELIIINDGSTDGSDKICDKLSKDSRIKVIHIENAGVSNARNIGLEIVRGEYIQFLDADDYIEKNMLEDLVKIADKNKPDLIISGIKKVDQNNKLIENILPNFDGITDVSKMMENFGEVQRTTGIYGYISNKFIKRSIIKENNLKFNTSIWLAEDLDFYLELYKYICKVYFCRYSYYYYLIDAENSSTTSGIIDNYLIQAKIILKEKELLEYRNSLNQLNLDAINFVVTNFIMSYMYQKFNYNYSDYIKCLNIIIQDKEYMESLVCNKCNYFENIILSLLSCKCKFLIYILFFIRTLLRDLYRKIKKLKNGEFING